MLVNPQVTKSKSKIPLRLVVIGVGALVTFHPSQEFPNCASAATAAQEYCPHHTLQPTRTISACAARPTIAPDRSPSAFISTPSRMFNAPFRQYPRLTPGRPVAAVNGRFLNGRAGPPHYPLFTRPVRTSQFRNMATKSRATGSVRNSSKVYFILRLQFGYCQVVAGRFCWAISLVRSS